MRDHRESTPSPTPALARYVQQAASAPLPEGIRQHARSHVLDTLAAIVACAHLEPAVVARRHALASSVGDRAVTLLPNGERSELVQGVFANAMTAHAAEINDFCPSAFVQADPWIVSAALGLAEREARDGERVLRAVVCGYEVACRLPKALGVENLKRGGMSTHSVGAAFGTAVAAASLLDHDETAIRHTLAYAAQQASGSYNWVRDIAHVEKAFVFGGMPARQGLEAALMVRAGFTGVDDPFDGAPNFLLRRSFQHERSDMDTSRLTEGLGERFELPIVAYKRYPVGGPTQPAVEAMLALAPEFDAAQVERVQVELPEMAATFQSARMPALNLPYLMALILEDRTLDFDQAQSIERMASPSIRALMARVVIGEDESQRRVPREESARVTVQLRDGTGHTRFVGHVKGYPTHPMTAEDVREKARLLMTPRLGQAGARRVIELVERLDNLPSIGPLIAALTAVTRS